jgi:glutathione synthase
MQAMRHGTRWIMAQQFLKQGTVRGDKRILLLNGKAIGQFGRIPKAKEFRSNLSLGGKKKSASLTAREKKMILSIRSKLLRDGLYFVGLDVIDGFLIEINVTSPAGIPEINELEESHLESSVVDFLELQVQKRRRSRQFR